MISLIVGLVLFIIVVILIIIAYKKDLIDLITLIIFPLVAASIFCLVCCIIGKNNHISEKEYLKLNFMAEHWNEMSSYEQTTIETDIDYWNENLNNGNNYWFKFELEDRSMYYIEIQK